MVDRVNPYLDDNTISNNISSTNTITERRANPYLDNQISVKATETDKKSTTQDLLTDPAWIRASKQIYKNQTGAAQPHVYSKDISKIKIPIPPLERQQEIIDYCEFNDNLIKQLEKEIENNKKHAHLFIHSIVK